jgi:hypothetical protein
MAGLSCRRGRERAPWEAGLRLPNGHPIVRMPFPAGTVVLCQQGNLSPPGRTHFKENNRYALDLSNASIPSLPVIAAAPGRVGYVYAGSDPADSHAGLGYGNHVKVDHGGSYFTMYAHLDTVTVKEGDILDSAAPIGTVGFTGAAGNRHLHFSLHQGMPVEMGVRESIPMDALVTAEAGDGSGFRAMSSVDLRDGQVVLWDGKLYGSENRPGTNPISAAAPPELAAQLDSGMRALQTILTDRRMLDTISREWSWRTEPGWAQANIAPILERTPRHAVGRYWLATAVHGAQGRRAEAEAIYLDLLASGTPEPTWETWLVSWCENRLGAIALQRGLVDEARSRFLQAARRAVGEPERAFAIAELRRLQGRSDAGP